MSKARKKTSTSPPSEHVSSEASSQVQARSITSNREVLVIPKWVVALIVVITIDIVNSVVREYLRQKMEEKS